MKIPESMQGKYDGNVVLNILHIWWNLVEIIRSAMKSV